MLIDVLKHLEEADVHASVLATEKERPGAIVDLELDGIRRRFVVEVRNRAPYPSELPSLEERRARFLTLGHPLLVAPYVSASLATRLTQTGWSWADQSGNFDIRAPQLRAKQRLNTKPPKPTRSRIPRGPGALAIIRFLIHEPAPDQPFGHEELSKIGRVSQPRATQVLKQLRDANLISGAGRDWFADREALLEAFLEQYQGPGGTELLFYSLDSPLEVTRGLVRWAQDQRRTLAISADVGPDLIAPWRRPTHVVAYLREALPITQLDLVKAKSREDANVILRAPDDASVFSVHPVLQEFDGTEITCADITQIIWDLKDLGGSDREEAADNLRKWLLSH